MTGDGVNDVLALKDADCGIAMASGAQAASQVAQLVLLESDFSGLPAVVAEGRRVINNIQRSAALYLVDVYKRQAQAPRTIMTIQLRTAHTFMAGMIQSELMPLTMGASEMTSNAI